MATTQRFSHTDSVRQSSYRILIILVVSLLLPSCCLAKPVHQQFDALDTWWFNSCDHNSIRHNHKPIDCTEIGTGLNIPPSVKTIVKNQMRTFKSFLKQEFSNMKKNYAAVKNANLHNLVLDWLPGPMTHDIFRSELKNKQILPPFHENLQKYALAFQYLEQLDISTEAKFNREARKRSMHHISKQMKTLLCEIETAVNVTCQTRPDRIPLTAPETIGLTKQSDLTQMYVQDWNVFQKFKSFCDSWTKFINKSFQGKKKNNRHKETKNKQHHQQQKTNNNNKKKPKSKQQ